MEGSHRIANGMEFVNDPAVIGKWKSIGSLASGEPLSQDALNSNQNTAFGITKELYFLPEGKPYWIFEGWTKGTLLVHHGGSEPLLEYRYTINSWGGRNYLLIPKAGEDNLTIVFEQVDKKRYSWESLGRRDNIHLPFVSDEKVLGTWHAVGYVAHKEDFLQENLLEEGLGLAELRFLPGGSLEQLYLDPSLEGGRQLLHDRWTKGVVLMQGMKTAPAYELRTVHGKEYLFLEWKMGNYIFGGMEPEFFVFQRKS